MNNLQQTVKYFTEEHKLQSNEQTIVLDILSELGEVSKEILKSTNYGKQDFSLNDDFIMEVGDLLYSLLNLLNQINADSEELLNQIILKYRKRLTKGSPGSANDI